MAQSPPIDSPDMKRKTILSLFGLFLLALNVQAGIDFDPQSQRLWITDFPAGYPCTMDRVLAVDRRQGWNRVSYDAAADTYTVAASLWIGSDDGSDTYVQCGRAGHTQETWIVQGDVVVHPSAPWPKDASAPRAVNRLTLGSSNEVALKASLKIAGATNAGHSLYVGTFPQNGSMAFWETYRGQLHVHNSAVTALVPDADHALGAKAGAYGLFLRGDSIHLRNAKIAWVKGAVSGLHGGGFDHVIENTVFEHCGAAIASYWDNQATRIIRGCTFRQCGTALADPQSRVTLRECAFENNQRNWTAAQLDQLTLLDCRIGAPAQTNTVARDPSEHAKKHGNGSRVVSQRHVIVEVVDAGRQPVANATVTIARPREGDQVMALTGKDGRTAAAGSDEAFLLTEFAVTATDKPEQPDIKGYAYDIRARAPGLAEAVHPSYGPTSSWEVVTLVLPRLMP